MKRSEGGENQIAKMDSGDKTLEVKSEVNPMEVDVENIAILDNYASPNSHRKLEAKSGKSKKVHGKSKLNTTNCSICGKTYSTQRKMQIHKKYVHNDVKRGLYQCQLCGNKLSDKHSVRPNRTVRPNLRQNTAEIVRPNCSVNWPKVRVHRTRQNYLFSRKKNSRKINFKVAILKINHFELEFQLVWYN